MAKRVALYARCSTADQHPEAQIEELRAIATQRGWRVVGEYVDHGVSGGRERRPELDRLQRDVGKGRVDIVAVWRFDRFARSVSHLVRALDDFNARGIDFVSVHDQVDTSTTVGRFTYTVMAAVAEMERAVLRERTRLGIQAARRRGARIGRPRVHVDVKRALKLRSEGYPMREVATKLGCGLSTLRRELHLAREAGEDGHDVKAAHSAA